MKKKLLIISTSRADFYLLQTLMVESFKKKIKSKFLLIGSNFGEKGNKVEVNKNLDKHCIKKIPIELSTNNSANIINFVGVLMKKFQNEIKNTQPDLIVILGDRFELLSIAYTATIMKIPIAHIHGGEISEGAFDDNFRHAITKLSNLHFVSTEVYKKRVIQLGEQKKNVFNVGSLGVQNLQHMNFYKKNEIESRLNIKINNKLYIITFHPVTLSKFNESIDNLLTVLNTLKNSTFVFTAPNIDPNNQAIFKKIKKFVKKNKNSIFTNTLGQKMYFSCLKICNGVIGNSSSGIIEAPSLKIPTINIGERQGRREMAESVISCMNNKSAINKAFKKINSKKFKEKILHIKNPYFKKNTTDQIINIIENIDLKKLIFKSFNDIEF